MSEATEHFFTPAARDTDRIVRRRSIVDRQATAQRFLFEAADEIYDGELDIDWDAPAVPGRPWLPAELISLDGTRLLRRATPEQRDELARQELVNILTLITYADNALGMLIFRDMAEDGDLVDDRARWMLKSVNTRTRNITMMGRLIDTTGLRPNTRPWLSGRLERFTLLVPSGILFRSLVYLVESAIGNLVRHIASDSSMQPHVSQIMTLHALSTRRHVDFAVEEFVDDIAERGRYRRFIASVCTALMALLIGLLFADRAVYADVGLPVGRARWAAWRSPSNRLRATILFGPTIGRMRANGLFQDALSKLILRAARISDSDGVR